MTLSYDAFTVAFLAKISEYDFAQMDGYTCNDIVDDYFKRAWVDFRKVCKVDLGAMDDETRTIAIPVEQDGEDITEVIEIVTDGMVVQWLKPYLFQQENLQNVLNTRDFSVYSPSELLKRIGETFYKAKRDYTQRIREYSYNHGDLTSLHI